MSVKNIVKKKISNIKKIYITSFVFRIMFFLAVIFIYFFYPHMFTIVDDLNIFKTFNVLGVIYFVWIIDIMTQLMPLKGYLSIGCLKQFKPFSKNLKSELINFKKIVTQQNKMNLGALKVLVLWITLTLIIGLLKLLKIITVKEIFVICAFFYVCDLICVLFFCPFQKWIMKNKCCATCRIFNWDHMMMFSPFVFVKGFYSWSLVLFSLIAMLIWEFTYFMHPERFFEETNTKLRCKNCKEKMCRK